MTNSRDCGLPDITVIVLNWNGKRFLGRCLTALLQTTYPTDRFNVIVADNASTDGSPAWVRERFPGVRVLDNGGNLGFGKGNNRAIQANGSPFVALLNSDTAVQADWLRRLIDPMLADRKLGATTAKLVYMNDYAPLALRCETFSPQAETGSPDERTLGVQVYAAHVREGSDAWDREVRLLNGFYAPERDAAGHVIHWTGERAVLGVPAARAESRSRTLELMLAAWRPDNRPVRVAITCGGQTVYAGAAAAVPGKVCVPLLPWVGHHARPLLQSAGSCILPDGSGLDRGTQVEHGHVYPSWDDGRYDADPDVFHFNGAACLLRREMLEAVGLFDERFFMYYEDMDLAWRARAQGWQIRYVPQARVRHVHSGSAGEWSPLFTYNVDLNRLLMLLKNAPWRLALQQLRRYAAETVWNAAQAGGGLLMRRPGGGAHWRRLWIRAKVCARLLALAPGVLASRRAIRKRRTVSQDEIERWLVPAEDDVG